MKRIIVSALIACATVFAQETVVTADTAAKVTDSAAQVVEPATPVTESAETASAEPATQTAEVVEPAASAPAPVNAPAAEKTWTHLWGVGATVPVEQYKSRGNKIDLINYGLDLSYTGVARFGLALHLSIAAGSSSTDNIRFEKNDDRLVGSFGAVEAGLGFSPVNTNGFTLVVLAVAGYEYAEFESDENEVRHSELGIVERRFTETMGALSVGGDLVLRFGLSEHIGIFASVGGRWLPITVTESSVRYEKDDDYVRTESYIEDDRGVYSVVPAIGAMWKF
ncbi:hypothetical protein [uncultured Fibrobacter sp.]|uniref:hypothetical protein n=1 Tax=uncultured Fibrobacter sp. TaxID=261512 RepID=UPI0025F61BA9|nr:hypothetical protein [uncultured Fibrobacter sp.]